MNRTHILRLACSLAFAVIILHEPVTAQTTGEQNQRVDAATRAAAAPEIDLEAQIHLLVGSGANSMAVDDGNKVPTSLEPALRHLRTHIRVNDFRVAGTFLHRVRSGRSLEVKGVGGSLPQLLPSPNANTNPYTPVFYQFDLSPVELKSDGAGRQVVSVHRFRFSMKIPVAAGMPQTASGGGGGYPVIQYEDTGISTGLSVPEGEPVVVGTMYTGQGGNLLAVVLVVRKVGR